jgi:two-component system cell cycle sensor histidine kinase/response regulator CckA
MEHSSDRSSSSAAHVSLAVLHLEDSKPDAALVEALLRAEWPQCRIRRVESAAQYEQAIAANDFDLILSDYSIPGYDGLAALDFAQARCPHKPFIFMSGTIGEEAAIEALKRGAIDYVIKDRPNRLISAVRQALALRYESEQRRHSEAARREAESRLREQAALLDKARDAIVATDLDLRIAYWNTSAERLYGWKAAEVFGRKLEELNLGFDLARFEVARRQLFAKGEWRGDFRLHPKQGGVVQVESTWSLVVDAEGRARSILFIDTDVTEKKKLEAQLLRAQRVESVGMLAGGVAHDLNNVLTPILMAVEILRLRLHDEADRRLLGNVEASAQHGAALVRQLLSFARGGEAKRSAVQIELVLGELRKLLRQALPKTIELQMVFGGRPWVIEADATQMNQVLMNLCINARDAMPEGGKIEIATQNVTIDGDFAADAEPGRYLHIAVADTGAGIPPEIVDRIFDPFFTTKASKGTGLGLSTVAGIVKNHGGFVNVESELGHGTTFHLFLPARAEEPSAFSDAPRGARPLPDAILLIEDEDCLRETLVLLLEHAGHRVIAAAGGSAALEEFERARGSISLVLTDMKLPGMSGAEIIQALRATAPDLRVIAMSAFMDAADLEKLRFPGRTVEYLAKPLTADMLLAAIRNPLPAPA